MENYRKKTTVQNRGVNFLELLTILFIGLKLTGLINWSWIWVLAPTWIPICIVIVICIIYLICAYI